MQWCELMENKYNFAMNRMMQAGNSVKSLAKTSPEQRENQIEEMKKRAENR
jgi:hypothetical protein